MHYILYIPGLGDERIAGQQKAVTFWRKYGVKPHVVQMYWADGQPFAPKLKKITDLIDKLAINGDKISLIAVSAGASAALNAFALRTSQVHRVALICGEIRLGARIGTNFRRKNPAFVESKDYLHDSLAQLTQKDRARIVSYHPITDTMVPPSHTKLSGATSKIMPAFGHFWGIAYGITLGAFGIIRWLKKDIH